MSSCEVANQAGEDVDDQRNCLRWPGRTRDLECSKTLPWTLSMTLLMISSVVSINSSAISTMSSLIWTLTRRAIVEVSVGPPKSLQRVKLIVNQFHLLSCGSGTHQASFLSTLVADEKKKRSGEITASGRKGASRTSAPINGLIYENTPSNSTGPGRRNYLWATFWRESMMHVHWPSSMAAL